MTKTFYKEKVQTKDNSQLRYFILGIIALIVAIAVGVAIFALYHILYALIALSFLMTLFITAFVKTGRRFPRVTLFLNLVLILALCSIIVFSIFPAASLGISLATATLNSLLVFMATLALSGLLIIQTRTKDYNDNAPRNLKNWITKLRNVFTFSVVLMLFLPSPISLSLQLLGLSPLALLGFKIAVLIVVFFLTKLISAIFIAVFKHPEAEDKIALNFVLFLSIFTNFLFSNLYQNYQQADTKVSQFLWGSLLAINLCLLLGGFSIIGFTMASLSTVLVTIIALIALVSLFLGLSSFKKLEIMAVDDLDSENDNSTTIPYNHNLISKNSYRPSLDTRSEVKIPMQQRNSTLENENKRIEEIETEIKQVETAIKLAETKEIKKIKLDLMRELQDKKEKLQGKLDSKLNNIINKIDLNLEENDSNGITHDFTPLINNEEKNKIIVHVPTPLCVPPDKSNIANYINYIDREKHIINRDYWISIDYFKVIKLDDDENPFFDSTKSMIYYRMELQLYQGEKKIGENQPVAFSKGGENLPKGTDIKTVIQSQEKSYSFVNMDKQEKSFSDHLSDYIEANRLVLPKKKFILCYHNNWNQDKSNEQSEELRIHYP